MRPDFELSRTPQIRRQKHTLEHHFYRIAPSGYFLMSVIFLERQKENVFHTSFGLIQLKSCNCIKSEKIKLLFIHNSEKTTPIYLSNGLI